MPTYYVKAVPSTCFQTFDFYVVAYLGTLLLLHVLYMSVSKMLINYVKADPYTCFSNITVYYAVAALDNLLVKIRVLRCGESKVLSAITCIVHVYNRNAYLLS